MAVLRNLLQDEMDELNRLRAENTALKAKAAAKFKVKLGQKGNIMVLGLQSFPVTLYKNQWETILDNAQVLRDFIAANNEHLSVK